MGVREVDGIPIPLYVAGVCGVHDKLTDKFCDCERLPVNYERAVCAGVGECPLGVTAVSLCQVRWGAERFTGERPNNQAQTHGQKVGRYTLDTEVPVLGAPRRTQTVHMGHG